MDFQDSFLVESVFDLFLKTRSRALFVIAARKVIGLRPWLQGFRAGNFRGKTKNMRELVSVKNPAELTKHIERFPDACVLVVGDIIMDEYIWGNVSRISPEAPVPVVEVVEETKMLGGAANVVSNIASLGGKTILCGVVGDDPTGSEILLRLKELGSVTDGIIVDPERPTSIKTRIIAQNQQVVRFDRESRRQISPQSIERLLGVVRELWDGIDAVVVADYGKGVVSGSLMKEMKNIVRRSNVVLGVDPKTGNFQHYKGVDVVTPNHHEAGAFCGIEIVDEESLLRAGKQMLEQLDCGSVLITQGKEGMTLFEREGDISHIPTMAKKVFDVTGAGDTVIAALCLSLASGMELKSAAMISNFAAGIVVGEVGTSSVRAEDLTKVIEDQLR